MATNLEGAPLASKATETMEEHRRRAQQRAQSRAPDGDSCKKDKTALNSRMQNADEHMQRSRIIGRPVFCQASFAAARRRAALLGTPSDGARAATMQADAHDDAAARARDDSGVPRPARAAQPSSLWHATNCWPAAEQINAEQAAHQQQWAGDRTVRRREHKEQPDDAACCAEEAGDSTDHQTHQGHADFQTADTSAAAAAGRSAPATAAQEQGSRRRDDDGDDDTPAAQFSATEKQQGAAGTLSSAAASIQPISSYWHADYPDDGAVRAPRASGADREAAAFRRRSGAACKHQFGTGHGELTRERQDEYRSYTMVCKTMGCDALVDRGRARIAAYRRGRLGLGPYEKGGEEDYQPGDGCGSWHCSRHYAASRFAYYQNAMAAQLRRGAGEGGDDDKEEEARSRQLIRWQRGTGDTDEVWVQPVQAALRAADAAESMVADKQAQKEAKNKRRRR